MENIRKHRKRRTKFRQLSTFGKSPVGRMYYPQFVKSFRAPHGSEIRHGFRLMTQYASALKPERKFLELRITVGYERNSLKETIIVEVPETPIFYHRNFWKAVDDRRIRLSVPDTNGF